MRVTGHWFRLQGPESLPGAGRELKLAWALAPGQHPWAMPGEPSRQRRCTRSDANGRDRAPFGGRPESGLREAAAET